MFIYFHAGARLSPDDDNWIDHARARTTGTFIISFSAACLGALCVACYLLWWRYDVIGEGYVPDSEPLTFTFFGAILAGMALVRHASKPLARG